MASSYIEFHENGFWAHDILVSIIAGYLSIEIKKTGEHPDWLTQYAEDLRINSYGNFVGFTSLNFDEFIISEDRKNIILSILKSILTKIDNDSEVLSLDYFNDYIDDDGKKIWSGKTISRNSVTKLIAYINNIINGIKVEVEPVWARTGR